jgi:hypothetical protein
VQDNAQEGRIDVDLAVILNEAQFPEFVHEEIDSGVRCANHLGQHLLRHFGKYLLRLVLVAVMREQQKSSRRFSLSMNPFFLNRFMNRLTRGRVVPTISARTKLPRERTTPREFPFISTFFFLALLIN